MALAHWGEAMTLSPNLNAPLTEETPARVPGRRRSAAGSKGRERREQVDRGPRQTLRSRSVRSPCRARPRLRRGDGRAAAAYPDDPDAGVLCRRSDEHHALGLLAERWFAWPRRRRPWRRSSG
jgi:hypothetical protein